MLTTLNKMRKNQKGFSLVELMVVVAIIGILAAVAIPNFQRFQRKAKQSEAKAALGGISGAESAFHAQWENYSSDLPGIGYVPDGTLVYNSGFVTGFAYSNAQPADYTGQALTTMNQNTLSICGAAPYNTMCMVGSAPALAVATSGMGLGNAATYTAGSEGILGGQVNDQWSINQAKALMNLMDGTL